jgi:hypothetical protein
MALVGIMLIMLVLMALTLIGVLGVWTNVKTTGSYGDADSLASNSVQLTTMSGNSLQALDAAESGVDYSRLWLTQQSAPPANTSAFAPSTLWGATISGTTPPRATVNYPNPNSSFSTFAVTIYPDATNINNAQKHYLIESIGTVGTSRVIVHAYVQEASLSKYAYLESIGYGGYWGSNNRYFDGPVHINSGPIEGLLWRDGTSPVFDYTGADAFSVSMATIPFEHNTSASSAAPITGADWATVSAGGPASIKATQPVVQFPPNTYMQEYAALGMPIPNPATAPPSSTPTTTGATVTAGGGIYYHGDIQQMTLSVVSNTEQVITTYQTDASSGASVETVVTIDPTANHTTIVTTTTPVSGSPSTTTQTVGTLTNGMIFCDGNIGGTDEGGISGVIADNAYSGTVLTHRNALTIATDFSHNANYDGNVTTNTLRQQQTNSSGQLIYRDVSGNTTTNASGNVPIYVPESSDTGNFVKNAGVLGLITDTANVNTHLSSADGSTQTSVWGEIELDASTYAEHLINIYNSGSRPPCTLLNVGSFISYYGAYVNTTSSTTGQVLTGAYMNRTYDQRVVNTPPPYFPTTGDVYDLISWQQVGSTIE